MINDITYQIKNKSIKQFKSFFEISPIRIQKILHMFQNAFTIAILSFYIGKYINSIFPEIDIKKKKKCFINRMYFAIIFNYINYILCEKI